MFNTLIPEIINQYGMDAISINGSYCYSFAEDLQSKLDEMNLNSEILCNENFLLINENDEVVGWNEKEFQKYKLEYVNYDATKLDFYHVFLYHNGLFYDAEAIEGVKHWLELPFFKRTIEREVIQ